MFVAQGGPFAISSLCWGYLCDKKVNGKVVVVMGGFLNITAFLFIGPVSFIPLDSSLALCIVMLIIQGIGVSAQLIAGLSVSHKTGR